MAAPRAIFENEIWIVRKNLEIKIQTAEITCLRGVAGYTLTDSQSNRDINII
jgi:hypothetical protein